MGIFQIEAFTLVLDEKPAKVFQMVLFSWNTEWIKKISSVKIKKKSLRLLQGIFGDLRF
jgi:hypothetical protein